MGQVPIDCLNASLKSAFRNLKSAILLCAMLLALSFTVQAQQSGKVPRVELLISASTAVTAPYIEAFRQGLRELGYVEGKNIVLEIRGGGAEPDRIAHLAAELVVSRLILSLQREARSRSVLPSKRPALFPSS
jgi:hypothetical protein